MWTTPNVCPGCGNPTVRGSRWCEKHQTDNADTRKERARAHDENAPWRKWYDLAIWQKIKAAFAARYPERALICQATENGRPCGRPATVTDHIVPHRGNWELFVGGKDYANLQGLCNRHHSQKTAAEDGGYGNARQHSHV